MGRTRDRPEDRARLWRRAAEVVARGAASFPLQRVGTVADAVDAILFLISEGSSWITGESINSTAVHWPADRRSDFPIASVRGDDLRCLYSRPRVILFQRI